MRNDFQSAMLNNKDVAWEIVKVFHPDVLEEYPNIHKEGVMLTTKDKLKITLNYDWVVIYLSLQSHITISIGIEFECYLQSGPKSIDQFEHELKNNKFRAWRFWDDSKITLDDNYRKEILLLSEEVNNILNKHQIPKPTAQQMSYHYHKD